MNYVLDEAKPSKKQNKEAKNKNEKRKLKYVFALPPVQNMSQGKFLSGGKQV